MYMSDAHAGRPAADGPAAEEGSEPSVEVDNPELEVVPLCPLTLRFTSRPQEEIEFAYRLHSEQQILDKFTSVFSLSALIVSLVKFPSIYSVEAIFGLVYAIPRIVLSFSMGRASRAQYRAYRPVYVVACRILRAASVSIQSFMLKGFPSNARVFRLIAVAHPTESVYDGFLLWTVFWQQALWQILGVILESLHWLQPDATGHAWGYCRILEGEGEHDAAIGWVLAALDRASHWLSGYATAVSALPPKQHVRSCVAVYLYLQLAGCCVAVLMVQYYVEMRLRQAYLQQRGLRARHWLLEVHFPEHVLLTLHASMYFALLWSLITHLVAPAETAMRMIWR